VVVNDHGVLIVTASDQTSESLRRTVTAPGLFYATLSAALCRCSAPGLTRPLLDKVVQPSDAPEDEPEKLQYLASQPTT